MKRGFRKVIRTGREFPRFASVEQESEFWDANSPFDFGDWQTVDEGELMAAQGEATGTEESVALTLDSETVTPLRREASRRGVAVQEFAARLLRRDAARLNR